MTLRFLVSKVESKQKHKESSPRKNYLTGKHNRNSVNKELV